MTGALESVLADASLAAADPRVPVSAVAHAIDAQPIAVAPVGARLERAVTRRPPRIAHAFVLDAMAMAGAA